MLCIAWKGHEFLLLMLPYGSDAIMDMLRCAACQPPASQPACTRWDLRACMQATRGSPLHHCFECACTMLACWHAGAPHVRCMQAAFMAVHSHYFDNASLAPSAAELAVVLGLAAADSSPPAKAAADPAQAGAAKPAGMPEPPASGAAASSPTGPKLGAPLTKAQARKYAAVAAQLGAAYPTASYAASGRCGGHALWLKWCALRALRKSEHVAREHSYNTCCCCITGWFISANSRRERRRAVR